MTVPDHILTFDQPVILVAASPVPVGPVLSMLPAAWPLLAADGGADALLDLGRRPDMVIGDMDSAVTLPDDLPCMALDGQDDTDLQKCLARIDTPLLVGLACLDGRFDHALAAIHALMTLRHDRPVMLVGAHDVVLRVRGECTFTADAGCRVSVWPLGRQAFGVSDGLRWQLDGLTMAAGSMIGTSNAAQGGMVHIRPAQAASSVENQPDNEGYAVIVPHSCLPAMLDALLPSLSI
ncbi:MAG: thiamine pyrophosphokinase [Candidatus Puniceispirillaceae bacterium]